MAVEKPKNATRAFSPFVFVGHLQLPSFCGHMNPTLRVSHLLKETKSDKFLLIKLSGFESEVEKESGSQLKLSLHWLLTTETCALFCKHRRLQNDPLTYTPT